MRHRTNKSRILCVAAISDLEDQFLLYA